MAIEARGAKFPYFMYCMAIFQRGNTNHIQLCHVFFIADSPEEADGKAYRFIHKRFPKSKGWQDHIFSVIDLSKVDYINNTSVDDIIECPIPA